jgi:diaminopropionate ammonia-lyase
MAGLACGEVSLLAWEILREGTDAFVTIEDDAAAAVMRLLARPQGSDPAIVAGESAVAGLAGFLQIAGHEDLRGALQLDRESVVLFFGSEGATDPALYAELVGMDAEAIVRNAE